MLLTRRTPRPLSLTAAHPLNAGGLAPSPAALCVVPRAPPADRFSPRCPGAWPGHWLCGFLASLVAQSVKSLTAMQETWVRSLGWKDPLEKEMATHSSILTWRIPWTDSHGQNAMAGYSRWGRKSRT